MAERRLALVVRWRPPCDTLSTPTSRRKGLAGWRGGVDVVVAAAAAATQQHHHHRRLTIYAYHTYMHTYTYPRECCACAPRPRTARDVRRRYYNIARAARRQATERARALASLCAGERACAVDRCACVRVYFCVCARAVPRRPVCVHLRGSVRECDARDNPTTETTTVLSVLC